MELCAEHLAQFHETVGQWATLARPVVARRRRTPGKADRTVSSGGVVDASDRADARSNGSHLDEEDTEAIDWGAVRSWAVSQGYEVSTRGRVAREVLDAYLGAKHVEP